MAIQNRQEFETRIQAFADRNAHRDLGADLLESTGWQIVLQGRLGVSVPDHAHLPLVVESRQMKLSKSRYAVPVDPKYASAHLCVALELLGLPPSADLRRETPDVLLDWAARSWNLDAVQGRRTIEAPARFAQPGACT